MKKRSMQKVAIVLSAMMLVGAGVGGTMAYLTDRDSKTNTFTVGSIDILLEEPNFKQDAPASIPMQVIDKDPQVTNSADSDTDAVVFLEVDIPKKNVVTAAADGTKEAAADKELFDMLGKSAEWIEVSKNDGADKATYVYGYSKPLAKGETTPALFTDVRLINLIEGQVLDAEALDIEVRAYGIQKDFVDGATVTGDSITKEVLQKFHTAVKNQSAN